MKHKQNSKLSSSSSPIQSKSYIRYIFLFSIFSFIFYLSFLTNKMSSNIISSNHDSKFSIDSNHPLDDSINGLSWFIQLSDIHVSRFYGKERIRDLKTFCTVYLNIIKPAVLVISGDLTDAKHSDNWGSEQYIEEWQTYKNIIDNYCGKSTTVLDIRGNHDTFGVPGSDSKYNYYKSFSERGKQMSSYQFRYESGTQNVTFIALDAGLNFGLKRPFNFFGILTKENLDLIERYLIEAKNRNDSTILFGHFPFSTIIKEHNVDLNILLSKNGFYLCGHLHSFLGLVPYMYTIHASGTLELELADWKDNRAFRLFAFDNGLFSFIDKTFHDDWPLVLFTNPKHAQFNNPINEPTKKMSLSTHIRLLIFSSIQIRKVEILIDNVFLGNAIQTKNTPLYTLKWDVKKYSNGIHIITAKTFDYLGKQNVHQQPFSIDNSNIPFKFLASYVLLTDHRQIFDRIFLITELFIICILLGLRNNVLKFYIMQFYDKNQFGNCWARRFINLSADSKLSSILIINCVYIAFGPWLFGELSENVYGIVCLHGIYIFGYGSLLAPFAVFFAVFHLWTFNLPLIFWTAYCIDCRRKNKWHDIKHFSGYMALAIWQIYLSWSGFGRAYGILAFIFSPLRTGSALLSVYIFYDIKYKTKF